VLFVPDSGQIDTLKRFYDLNFGIESFWISFVLTYGIIPGLAFFAALFLFCRDVVRAVRPGGVWIFVFFFLVASTSVSLSSKSPIFAELLMITLPLLRRPRPAAARHIARRPRRIGVGKHALSPA
jgi:hypothetical protein